MSPRKLKSLKVFFEVGPCRKYVPDLFKDLNTSSFGLALPTPKYQKDPFSSSRVIRNTDKQTDNQMNTPKT